MGKKEGETGFRIEWGRYIGKGEGSVLEETKLCLRSYQEGKNLLSLVYGN